MAGSDEGHDNAVSGAWGLFETGEAAGVRGQGQGEGHGEGQIGDVGEVIGGLKGEMGEVEAELREWKAAMSGLMERMLGCESVGEMKAIRNRAETGRRREGELEGILRAMEGAVAAHDGLVGREERRRRRAAAGERIAAINKAVGESLKKMRKEQEKMERLRREVEEIEGGEGAGGAGEEWEGEGAGEGEKRVMEMAEAAGRRRREETKGSGKGVEGSEERDDEGGSGQGLRRWKGE